MNRIIRSINLILFLVALAVGAGCGGTREVRRTESPRIAEGRRLYDRARYEEAERHFTALSAEAARENDALLRAQCLKWLGSVQLAYGRQDEALARYRDAERVFDSLATGDAQDRDRALLAEDERRNTRNNIAVVLKNLWRLDEAASVHRQVLEEDLRHGDPLPIAVSRYNLGTVHYMKAVEHLDITRDSAAANAQLDSARALYRASLTTFPTADAWLNLGNAFAAGRQLDSAIAAYAEADSLYSRLGYPVQRALCLGNIGVLQIERGRASEAVSALQQGIGIVEALRGNLSSIDVRSSFVSNKYFLYENLIDILVSDGRTEDAFVTVGRAKARSFLDMIGSKAVGEEKRKDPAVAALIGEERALHDRIAALMDEPDSATRIAPLLEVHSSVLERLRAFDPEYASVKSVTPPSADSLRTLLDDSTALIEYFLGEVSSFVFVLRADTLIATRLELPSGTAFEERIETLRRKLYVAFPGARDMTIRSGRLLQKLSAEDARAAWYRTVTDASWMRDLADMHRILLSPVESHLTGMTQLYIVPHGPLHHLPFQAFVRPEDLDRDTGRHVARPRYLIEDRAIAYLPSSGVLPFARQRSMHRASSSLVIGDPVYADPAYRRRPLAGALIEADSVARYLPAPLLLTRDAAEESRIKQEAAHRGVIHFATHGELNTRDPLRSRILLAAARPDASNDGSLTVGEVFNLDLASSLVTLSACQTAQVATEEGRHSPGDDLVGLTRSFFFAGTPSVIASLWVVDDAATLSWMTHFYRAWTSGLSKAQAARAASLDMLQRPADPDWIFPYYWGAFILFGEMH